MNKTTVVALTIILGLCSIFNTGCNSSINNIKNTVQQASYNSNMSASPMIEENNASKIFDWLWDHRSVLSNMGK